MRYIVSVEKSPNLHLRFTFFGIVCEPTREARFGVGGRAAWEMGVIDFESNT